MIGGVAEMAARRRRRTCLFGSPSGYAYTVYPPCLVNGAIVHAVAITVK